MADKTEKRTLTTDVKNFFDNKIKGSIVEGDISRYKIPPTLPDEAIKVSPKKIPSNKIEEVNELEAAFNHAMEKAYEKNRLPTKYTKEGLLESMMMFNTGTMPAMLELSKQKLKGYTKEDGTKVPPKKREYIEGYTDIAKSILRGGPKFIQSASEFVLTPIDYLFSTEFQEKFNKLMDTKEVLGEAETLPGGIAELVAEYAVPLTAATKIAKGAKTFKQIKNLQSFMGTSKASKIAQRMSRDAFILGLAETFVQSGGKPNEEYGINYKIPFTNIEAGRINKPEPTEGLTGRELALATFRNKFKYAREGTLIGGGFPLLAKTAQLTAKFGVKPVAKFGLRGIGKGMDGIAYVGARAPASYVTKPLAKLVRQTPIFLGTNVIAPLVIGAFTKQNPLKVLRQLPPFSEWRMQSKTNPNKTLAGAKSFDDFLSNLRSFNEDTLEMGLLGESLANKIKASTRRVNKGLEDLDAAYYELASGFQKNYNKGITSPVGRNYELDRVLEYLKGQRKLDTLPKEYQFSAKDIGDNLDKLRKSLSEMLPKNERFADFKKELLDRGNKYMRASFAVFENPMYQPLVKDKANAVEYILKNVMRGNKDFRIAAKESYPNMSIDKGQRAYAEGVVDNILHTGRAEKMDPIDALRKIGTKFLRNDDYKFLKKGEDLPVAIQKLLGEGKSLRNSVLTTTAEMTGEIYTKRAFDELYNILKASGQLVDNEAMALGAGRVGFERITKIPGLGVLNSKLQGKFVSKELAASIANQGGILDKLIKASIYRHLLQFKVLTQMGKTVFSPQTQVRNVYSAGFFPFARGHIGGNASVTDSFKIVLEDIFPKGRINKKDLFNFIEKEIELGTMDENIIASELGAVLNDIKGGAINTLDELFEAFTKKALVKNATRLYAGGDSGWKIYGRQYVKSQMSGILPTIEKALEYANHMGLKGLKKIDPLTGARRSLDDVLDLISAHEIRNVYPTYSKVPPIIQGIRKLPFGNFVAFPAEIMRTATRIMDFNLKQMSHSNPAIRQLGIKGALGATMAFGGLGAGVTALSQALTGTSEAQWDAYKRSFGADWDRNANLVAFTAFDKNGKAKAFNFSYFSPYDFLQKPINAIIQKAEQQNLSPQDTEVFIMEMMLAKDGPIMEMLSPFLSEQLGLEALLDVQPGGVILGGRGGRTSEGVRIYSESDDIGDKIQKSFMHLMNAVEPGVFSTGQKFVAGATDDLTKGGQRINLRDELIALMSGVRIINIDILKSMEYKTGAFNRAMRSVDDTEDLYSPKGYKTRGPDVVLEEYNQMQLEAYRIQQGFFTMIQDARTIGLSDLAIRKKLREQRIGSTMLSNLMKGTFTPVNYSEARFEKKVAAVKRLAREKTKESDEFNYRVGYSEKAYLYPKLQLDSLKRSYRFKKLDPEGRTDSKANASEDNPNTKGFFGASILDKLVPGQPFSTGPGIIQRGKNLIEKTLPGRQFDSKVTTPPLPETPMPSKQLSQAPNVDPQTNLTGTETALLSPTEKVIAGRS
tara:strand:+ start:1325 stop:5830 length:4506 start_codon:yes stop_codon:yes gene_type:complete